MNLTKYENTVTKAQIFPMFGNEEAARVFDSMDITETSRKDYKARIPDFLTFVAARGSIYQNILLDYKTSLDTRLYTGRDGKTKVITAATKNKYLTTAKLYLRQLHRLFSLPDYSTAAKVFKQSDKHKRPGINTDEMSKVAAAIAALPADLKGTRAKALFCLLAFQGLRQIEIRRLRVSDIDFSNGIALIQGKGKDDTEPITLHPKTAAALRDYIQFLGSPEGYIFQSIGNRKSTGMVSMMTLQREIKTFFKEYGINKTVHGFRHFYITQLLERKDIRDVRKFSRHKNFDMLIIYDDERDTRKKAPEMFDILNDVINF